MLKSEPHDPKTIGRKCLDRFWNRVNDANGDANQCWHFRGTLSNSGYFPFYYWDRINLTAEHKPTKRYITAHRFSALIDGSMGSKINDKVVMHMCDNKQCVNPHHLRVGTQLDNMQDMIRKNRQVNVHLKGETNGNSKLTEADVIEIRRLKSLGMRTQAIADKFNVGFDQTQKIITHRAWKHI